MISRRTTLGGRRRTLGAISATTLVVAALAGCSSSTSSESSSTSAAAASPAGSEPAATAASVEPSAGGEASGGGVAADANGMSIQFVNPLPSYPAWRLIGDCMKDEADARGAVLTESGPSGQTLDASAMIQQIQQAVANKVDGVVTFPASEGFTEVLKQAQSAGVLTGTLYGPGGADSGADVNAGPDWGDIGAQLVNAVSALPGDHVLGLVAQGDTGLGKLWLDGVKAAAAATDNVTIGGEVYTGDDASKALPQVTALLTAHPDVTEIVTHMGTTTPGAVAAIKALGLEGKTFLLAGGHDNGGTEAVQEGTANLMMLVDLCTLGKQMVDGMVDVHNGQPAPEIPVKIAVVGKDEIQGYLDKGWT